MSTTPAIADPMPHDVAAPEAEGRSLPPPNASRDAASAELICGPVRLKAEVRHTPAGLVALGACVTSILLGAAAIVWVATATPRRHPVATALALRRR